MWHPAFVNNAVPSYEGLFVALYIVNIVSAVALLLYIYRRYFFEQAEVQENSETKQQQYQIA